MSTKKQNLANSMRRRPSLKKEVTANEETAKKVVAKVADQQPKPAPKPKPKKETAKNSKATAAADTKKPATKKVATKRLTIDLPPDLHKKLKMATIESGGTMRDHVIKLIEKSLR